MTTAEIWIEIGKMLSPIATVGLAAYLAARYYERNKRVDFSLKLSEKVLEEVYSPILVMIEDKPSVLQGDGYEGLSFDEVKVIDNLFKTNRHLVNPKLRGILSGIHEDFIWLLQTSNHYDKTENVFKDEDREFLNALIKENEHHLKRIGFYSKGR